MEKKETLLEIAQKVKIRTMKKVFDDEEIELCTAWAKGEISLKQVTEVVPFIRSETHAYVFISNCFKYLVQSNKIQFI